MAQFQNSFLLLPALATAICLVAAACDLKTRRIPNWLTLPAFLSAMVLQGLENGWRGVASGLAAALAAGAIFFLFHLAGGMGAGDVKLITAVSAYYGLAALPYLLIATSIAGGIMAVLLSLRHGRLRETIGNIGALALHHKHAGLTPHESLNVSNATTLRLPYAVAIAAGCIFTNFIVLG